MLRALRRLAAPSTTPITVAEAKAHLRVDGTADDTLVALYLEAATETVERETGRALLPQDWEMRLAYFPPGDASDWRSPRHGVIEPWHAPLISVTSVKTVSATGVETTLSPSAYQVVAPSGPTAQRGRISPAAGTLWPSTERDLDDPVRVVYRAGYATVADVPAALRQAILLVAGDLYAHREASTAMQVKPNPTVERLMAPYRLFWG